MASIARIASTTIYQCTERKRYHCAKCKQDFTIRTKTVFGDSKLPLRKWYIAVSACDQRQEEILCATGQAGLA